MYIVHLTVQQLKEIISDIVDSKVGKQLEKYVAGETYGDNITIEQAMKYASKSRQWIYDQFENGKLTKLKIGRRTLIEFQQLKNLIVEI